jgi:hypothetical protein
VLNFVSRFLINSMLRQLEIKLFCKGFSAIYKSFPADPHGKNSDGHLGTVSHVWLT